MPVSDSDVLRDLLLAEKPGTVIEIGLAYGSSALAIAEALAAAGGDSGQVLAGKHRMGARTYRGGRDLAAEYAVAIGTARRAVLELRDRGLVVTLPGKGTYVVGRPRVTMWATALTTAAALPVLRPPTSPGPTDEPDHRQGRSGSPAAG